MVLRVALLVALFVFPRVSLANVYLASTGGQWLTPGAWAPPHPPCGSLVANLSLVDSSTVYIGTNASAGFASLILPMSGSLEIGFNSLLTLGANETCTPTLTGVQGKSNSGMSGATVPVVAAVALLLLIVLVVVYVLHRRNRRSTTFGSAPRRDCSHPSQTDLMLWKKASRRDSVRLEADFELSSSTSSLSLAANPLHLMGGESRRSTFFLDDHNSSDDYAIASDLQSRSDAYQTSAGDAQLSDTHSNAHYVRSVAVVEVANEGYVVPTHATDVANDGYVPFSKRLSTASLPYEGEVAAERIELTSVVLGRGQYGVVVQGRLQNPSHTACYDVAVKTLKKTTLDAQYNFRKEVDMVEQFRHQHIVNVLAKCMPARTPRQWHLVFELADGGSLVDFLRNSANPLLPSDMENILRQILAAVSFIGELGFAHRDVAARNCLVFTGAERQRIVKLSDFGLCRELTVADEDEYENDKDAALCGYQQSSATLIPPASAPEMDQGTTTPKSDVFMFGLFMWEVYARAQPFPYQPLYYKQLHGSPPEPLPALPHMPPSLRDIMVRCVAFRADDRPSFAELSSLFAVAGDTEC